MNLIGWFTVKQLLQAAKSPVGRSIIVLAQNFLKPALVSEMLFKHAKPTNTVSMCRCCCYFSSWQYRLQEEIKPVSSAPAVQTDFKTGKLWLLYFCAPGFILQHLAKSKQNSQVDRPGKCFAVVGSNLEIRRNKPSNYFCNSFHINISFKVESVTLIQPAILLSKSCWRGFHHPAKFSGLRKA